MQPFHIITPSCPWGPCNVPKTRDQELRERQDYEELMARLMYEARMAQQQSDLQQNSNGPVGADPWGQYSLAKNSSIPITQSSNVVPVVWIQAGVGSYTSINPDVMATDTQTVIKWKNSGSGGDFFNFDTSVAPIFGNITRKTPNNKPCIYSLGGVRGYTGSLFVSSSNDFTAIFAMKSENIGFNQYPVSKYYSNGNLLEFVFVVQSGVVKLWTQRDTSRYICQTVWGSIDTNWHIFCIKKSGFHLGMWIDGQFQHSFSGSTELFINNKNSPFNIGCYADPKYNGSGYIQLAEMRAWNQSISENERISSIEELSVLYNIPLTGDNLDINKTGLFFVGDSITMGDNTFTAYPSQTATIVGRNLCDFVNLGQSGEKLGTISDPTSVAGRFSSEILPYGKVGDVVIVWAGSNDIKLGDSAIDVQDRFIAYCDNVKSNGLKVIYLTIIKRTDYTGTMETYRQQINSWLVASGSLYCDAIVDVAADPQLDYTLNPSNFKDNIHLNDSGSYVVASLVSPVLSSII